MKPETNSPPLSKILKAGNTYLGELFLSLTMLGWAILLFAPWWDVFDSSPSYNVLSGLLPEWMWGIVLLSISLFWIVNIVRLNDTIRGYCSLISSFFWVIVTMNFVLTASIPTGVVAYGLMALLSSVIYLKITRKYLNERLEL